MKNMPNRRQNAPHINDGIEFYVSLLEYNIPRKKGLVQRLEDEITVKGMVVTFWFAFTFMFVGGLVFGLFNGAKDTTEYCSYIFPCCGAIVAGMTVYYDHRKGVLFIISLFFLYLGVIAFMTIHGHKAEIVAASTATALFLMMVALASLANVAVRDSFRNKRGKDRFFAIAVQIAFVIFSGLIIFYAASYVHFNYGCFKEDGKITDCQAIWKRWHSLSEFFWPLTSLRDFFTAMQY